MAVAKWSGGVSGLAGVLLLALFGTGGTAWAQGSLPRVNSGGIVNAADYGPSIPAGAFFAIYGANLAPGLVQASTVPLPANLGGVSVWAAVSGQTVAAPLLFVSPGQINAQMPYGTGGQNVRIIVQTSAGYSNETFINVEAVAPRFYTKTMDGRGEALLLHTDYAAVSNASPAVPGEVVLLYLSGLGEVNPPLAAGAAAGDGLVAPLNEVPAGTVEVWVNAQKVQVYWAGLAPYFAGLYQINFQMPPTLPDGMAEIEVRCQTKRTQSPVTVATARSAQSKLSPEEVVRESLAAQARGDIDAMFSYWALDQYDDAAEAEGRAALTLLRDNAGIGDFQFTPVATGYGDLGTMALVRAEISYTLSAPGETYSDTVGIIATLVGGDGQWRILRIDPDDLLNRVIYNRSAGPAANGLPIRAVELGTPEEQSRNLSNVMVDRPFNEAKLVADGVMSRVGAIPGAGDAAAQVYQTGCVCYDFCQMVEEGGTRGFTPIFFLKFSQVGIGLVQIGVELLPGVDTASDMVAMWLEQVTSRHEMQRDAREFAELLSKPRFDYNPWLFLPPTAKWQRPAGLTVSDSPDVETAYGRPPQGIGLTKPEHIGIRIPFIVVGEVEVPGELSRIAEKLGARQLESGKWKVPVDLTQLAKPNNIGIGEPVMEHVMKHTGPKGQGTVVSWQTSCARGFHELRIALHNGEIAQGPEIVNKYMNYIQDLLVSPLTDEKLKVGVGEEKQFYVKGVSGLAGEADIDLSTQDKHCLHYAVTGDTASVTRAPLFKAEGLDPGTSTMDLTVFGPVSRLSEQFPDVTKSVQIEVGEPGGGRSWSRSRDFLFYNNRWNASFSASVTTTGELVGCESQEAGFFLVLNCYIPLADTDPPVVDTYTITTSISNVYTLNENDRPGENYEQVVYGQFNSEPMIEGGKDGGTFVKTLQVPRGKGQYNVSFSVIVYYKHKQDKEEPRWKAGEMLFRFYIRR